MKKIRPLALLVLSFSGIASPLTPCSAEMVAPKTAGKPDRPLPIFNVRDYGAKGDGVTYDTDSIVKAVDACAGTGGTVLLSGGVFVSAQLQLKGQMTLHIAKDAILRGGNKPEDYPVLQPDDIVQDANIHRELKNLCRSLLYADKADSLTITGEGIIDGNGANIPMDGKHGKDWDHGTEAYRPSLLRIFRSKDVIVSRLTLTNPRMWTQAYVECDRLLIERLKVRSSGLYAHNMDGIDLVDCHDTIVRDCDITSQDDGICLKSQGPRGLRNVIISGNSVFSRCNGIKFGTASFGPVENIRFHNNVVHSAGWAGFVLESVDGGTVKNIEVKNLGIFNTGRPIFIILGDRTTRRADIKSPSKGPGSLGNISFEGLRIGGTRDGKHSTSVITGIPGTKGRIQNISFKDVVMQSPGGNSNVQSKATEYLNGYPYESSTGGVTPAYGFFVRHADNVTFTNVRASYVKADARTWLATDNVTKLVTENCVDEGKASKAPAPLPPQEAYLHFKSRL